ncbi:MAG: TatD family hydrolase [Bacteroidota bacterium]
MNIIDTHAHIYLPEFDKDRAEMLGRAEKEGIKRVIMPAIDSLSHSSMLQAELENPGTCLSMMGVHPCSVKSNYQDELKIARDHFEKRSFIAVGEIGLDFYWDISFAEQQYKVFNEQIAWALHYDIPIVIHSRNSIDECIQVVSSHQNGKLKGVFHCFSGNVDQAQQIIELGFYLGIGGVLTFKNSGLDVVIKDIDLKNLVLETDAPYLAPVPFRGKRNECSYIKYVAQKLAELKNIDVQEVAGITTANAEKLFRL